MKSEIENRSFGKRRIDPGRSRTGPKSKIENGFTLLEVVVAMAIVGLGVVTVIEIFSMGLRLETASAARTDAVAYSRQVMDTLLIRKSFDMRGDSGSIGRTHRWQADVQPIRDNTQLAPPNWAINRITLRMRYPDGARDKWVEISTLRIQKKKDQ